VRPRKLHLLLAASLGAAIPVVPAIASSQSAPTVSGLESRMWSPAQVALASGGTVSFEDASDTVPHGVVWESGDPETPVCNGVPAEGETNWKGSCTFTKAGVYRYYCSVHGMAMSGTIEVSAPATTPTAPPPVPTAPGGAGSTPSSPTSTAEPPAGAPAASPLAGGTSRAIALARSQRGKSVRGSIELSPAGAGARLEIDLLASGAALGRGRHAAPVRVGRLARSALKPGRVSFTASLNGSGRAALRRRGRLALTVRIALTPAHGATVSVTRLVVVRPAARHA
jgi:plastocyanin